MGNASNSSLGALREQAIYRADMANNNAVTTSEWNSYLSNSYKELYDLLVGAYGNDYYVAEPYQFTTTNAQGYTLPDGSSSFRSSDGSIAPQFYKLLGVDLQYSGAPNGWVTLRKFEFIERNKYAFPNTQVNWSGYTNIRYRLQGDDLYIVPVPQQGQTVRAWYIPVPTPLQYMLPCGLSLGSVSITLSDTVGLTSGMSVSGTGIPTDTTVSSVGSLSVVLSAAATSSRASSILSFWNDSTVLNGISGWEEFVIVDAAIKAQIKQENDISGLVMQKQELKQRIEAMAEGRDAGQASHVSDALGASSPWGSGMGGGSFGTGGWGDW